MYFDKMDGWAWNEDKVLPVQLGERQINLDSWRAIVVFGLLFTSFIPSPFVYVLARSSSEKLAHFFFPLRRPTRRENCTSTCVIKR